MKYIITFMKKSGKVKGKVGCNSDATMGYIIENWKLSDKKGFCIVTNTETKKEDVYKK